MAVLEVLTHPLVFWVFILIASLYILLKSADYIVLSIGSYAKRLGLSDAIIGLVVIAMAASAPEIISSLTGFLSSGENVGFGSILGANMVHVGFALGILCLVGRKVKLEPNIFTKRRLLMWAFLMLPFILALDGQLSRPDGAILVIAFCTYLGILWKLEGTLGKIKKNIHIKHIWKDSLVFLLAFAALMLSGRWLVTSSVQIANELNVPAYFIALTIIGIGTTIPDIAIELKSVFSKREGIGLGDLLGSLVIELLLFFGILALVKPIQVNLGLVLNAFIFLVLLISAMIFFLNKKELTWKHGAFFMGGYLLFLLIEIYKII